MNLSERTKVSLAFAVLGAVCWLVAARVTDVLWIQWGVLVAVGVVAPTLINEYRR